MSTDLALRGTEKARTQIGSLLQTKVATGLGTGGYTQGGRVQLSRVNLPCSLLARHALWPETEVYCNVPLHCYVTLSGAQSGGEMCRNFSAESELKLFGCGRSCNLHFDAAAAFQLDTRHTSKMMKLLRDDGWAQPIWGIRTPSRAFLGEADTDAVRDPASQWQGMRLISIWGAWEAWEKKKEITHISLSQWNMFIKFPTNLMSSKKNTQDA